MFAYYNFPFMCVYMFFLLSCILSSSEIFILLSPNIYFHLLNTEALGTFLANVI